MSHDSQAHNFVDSVRIRAQSGNGGAGLVSFRREKYIPKGGPDGGDGGDGGNVIVTTSAHERTLRKLRYQSLYRARNGQTGLSRKKHGKNGDDVVISVPMSTVIRNAHDNSIVSQLLSDGDSVVLLHGGMGGRGNVHFKSAVRQVPSYAQKGKAGLIRDYIFELELSSDASFIGMPNVGKSTLLKVLTNANPRIGNYPFTTLIPNMGSLIVRHNEFVLSDIPGIVKGAADGRGLGLHFLRHIKRSKVLFYVLDASVSSEVEMVQQYATVQSELAKYRSSEGLVEKPSYIVISKIDDSPYLHNTEKYLDIFRRELSKFSQHSTNYVQQCMVSIDTTRVVCVSAHMMRGIDSLKELLYTAVEQTRV